MNDTLNVSAACCDLCGTPTINPRFLKESDTWYIWFFCSEEHGKAFVQIHTEDQTMHTKH